MVGPITYSVLIRTFNCEGVLPRTLEGLKRQTLPPAEYIFVDSGSTDGTLSCCPPGASVYQFVGETFNYSEAINQGLKHVSTEYVLIISSHTVIGESSALERVLTLLDGNEAIGAAYMRGGESGELQSDIIDRQAFTGFNGLWNSCSIIKMALLKKRCFRPEVFAGEDQEWARWLLYEEGKVVARFIGAKVANNNPRRYSFRKHLNDYVGIAYYANRRLLGWRNLAHVGLKVLLPGRWYALRDRAFNAILLLRLLACYLTEPRARSRYF